VLDCNGLHCTHGTNDGLAVGGHGGRMVDRHEASFYLTCCDN
jgi:hypothetical protein